MAKKSIPVVDNLTGVPQKHRWVHWEVVRMVSRRVGVAIAVTKEGTFVTSWVRILNPFNSWERQFQVVGTWDQREEADLQATRMIRTAWGRPTDWTLKP